MSSRIAATSALAILVALGAGPRIDANGPPIRTAKPGARPLTPEEQAVAAYNIGIEHRTRAAKAETRAGRARTEAERVTAVGEARTEYQEAFDRFEEAAALNPSMPHAWNGMGFAHRKLGDYASALEAYDRALALAPNFPDALEYRGEAYLALNRVGDAKQAYLSLFAIDRAQAELLMKAMKEWVVRRTADPAGADPSDVSALSRWLDERSAIARQTRLMGRDTPIRAW